MKSRKNNPVDVCIITTIHPPYDARIYERELKSLLEVGYSVCLISPWKRPRNPWLTHKWISLPVPKKRINRIFHGFYTFIAAYRQAAKVYHFHDIDFIIWAVFLKFLKHVPVVYDCHDNYPEEILYNKEWISPFLRKCLSELVRKAENWCVKRLHYCIVVVPNLEDRFSSLGAKTVMVRNFTSSKPNRRITHDRALIYIGSLLPAYGSDILLDIARELKSRKLGFPLIIVDSFPSVEIKKKYIQCISQENLNIIIHPKVKPKNLDILLSKACIGLSVDQDLPNMRVAYHTKLFEYMAMGLPVVASDLPNTKKIINDASCGILVSPDNPREYVEAAVHLLDNPADYLIFQENGYKAVEKLYNWDIEKRKLAKFYDELVERL